MLFSMEIISSRKFTWSWVRKSVESPSICRVCLQYIPDFASSPKTKLVTARTLGGNVFFDTVEMKTLKEFFLSSYKSKNCLKTAVNLKNGQSIS